MLYCTHRNLRRKELMKLKDLVTHLERLPQRAKIYQFIPLSNNVAVNSQLKLMYVKKSAWSYITGIHRACPVNFYNVGKLNIVYFNEDYGDKIITAKNLIWEIEHFFTEEQINTLELKDVDYLYKNFICINGKNSPAVRARMNAFYIPENEALESTIEYDYSEYVVNYKKTKKSTGK